VGAVCGFSTVTHNYLPNSTLGPLAACNDRIGTAIALFRRIEEVCMFALSAILIGVIGVFYVRRRSARKKQSV
jgi:hypothetical protein